MRKRAFVISPIGPENSGVREHADDVFDYIIRPALEASGVDAFRADHLQEPGSLSDQMYRELFGADMCIALLTGGNANVYYELALAQAAGQPVIVLIQKGENLPFDVRDLRTVQYDLKPRPLAEGVYAEEMVAHIRSLRGVAWQVPSPFGQYADCFKSSTDDIGQKFYPRSMDYGDYSKWMVALEETEEVLYIAGFYPDRWHFFSMSNEAVIRKAESGCRVNLLLFSDQNPVLNWYFRRGVVESIDGDPLATIRSTLKYFHDLAEKNDLITVREIRSGFVAYEMTVTDQKCMIVPCLDSEKSQYSPLWEAVSDSHLYRTMRFEFESLWQTHGSN